MGHQRLKKLPRSHRWDQVVELLDDGGSAQEVAAASARAIDQALTTAASDPSLTEAILFLAALPGAAREPNYVPALSELGIRVSASPSLIELLSGIDRAVDYEARIRGRRSDLGEIAQLAAASSLTKALTSELPTLFGTTPSDVRVALGKLDTPQRFAGLARSFFAELMHRSLEYYLARAYARFIGPRETFSSISHQEQFREALAVHCYEAALIVEQYAADWFSKARLQGGISRQRASVLARTAMRKLRVELSHRNRVR